MSVAAPSGRPIRNEVLDCAERWIRRVGPNGFSYGDIAAELGIRAPSIHHHFPTKDELVEEVAERYRHRFARLLGELDESQTSGTTTSRDLLLAYAGLFADAGRDDLACLCGSMAADWTRVGDRSQRAVSGFFDDQREWLAGRLSVGLADGEFRSDVDVPATAAMLLAMLEGSMLIGRADGTADQPIAVTRTLLQAIASGS